MSRYPSWFGFMKLCGTGDMPAASVSTISWRSMAWTRARRTCRSATTAGRGSTNCGMSATHWSAPK
jgi:hypothetical protein